LNWVKREKITPWQTSQFPDRESLVDKIPYQERGWCYFEALLIVLSQFCAMHEHDQLSFRGNSGADAWSAIENYVEWSSY